MINILDQEEDTIAEKIYDVFQASYAVEAELLGAKDFPPLKRTILDYKNSENMFNMGAKIMKILGLEKSIKR